VTRDDIAAALSAVLSQRLIRRLCLHCRAKSDVPEELKSFIPSFVRQFQVDPLFYKAVGCDLCEGSGYHGRLGIFELLEVSDAVAQAILDVKHASVILRTDPNFRPMIIDGIHKVFLGHTSVEQLQTIVRWNLEDALSYIASEPPRGLRSAS
jgi:type II secretory ATPase GspE/PulE/Tfp pilus assembly ATPase PilB-like protein